MRTTVRVATCSPKTPGTTVTTAHPFYAVPQLDQSASRTGNTRVRGAPPALELPQQRGAESPPLRIVQQGLRRKAGLGHRFLTSQREQALSSGGAWSVYCRDVVSPVQ